MRVILWRVNGGEKLHAIAHRDFVFKLRVMFAKIRFSDFFRLRIHLVCLSARTGREQGQQQGSDEVRASRFSGGHGEFIATRPRESNAFGSSAGVVSSYVLSAQRSAELYSISIRPNRRRSRESLVLVVLLVLVIGNGAVEDEKEDEDDLFAAPPRYAVAQSCTLPAVGNRRRVGPIRRPAYYESAIRRSAAKPQPICSNHG